MKVFFLITIVAFFCSEVCQAADVQPPRTSKPNIVFIMVDDMGWGDLGVFYQNARRNKPAFQTPALDKMANSGIQLRRHYCGAPVCAPSRASLFSGVHQGNARVIRNNGFDLPLENSHTLATVLKQAGYKTALIGKWGIAGGPLGAGSPEESSAFPTHRGFDYFFGYLDHSTAHSHYPANGRPTGKTPRNQIWDGSRILTDECDKSYSTDMLTARAKKWIVDECGKDSGKPFFLAITYTAPHSPMSVATQPYPKGGGLKGGMQWIGKDGELTNTSSGQVDSYIEPQYARKEWPDSEKRFASMMMRIDNSVGDILKLLDDLRISGNTMVVFTSDNGAHNEGGHKPEVFRSYGPFDGIKRDLYEGGFTVPAFVRWPAGIPKGKVTTLPSQFHDWMATFADLAGVPVPARSDGKTLLPTLTGKGEQEPSIIYSEYVYPGKTPNYEDFSPEHRSSIRGQQQVIYVGKYKGIRRDIKSHADDFSIYDTAQDTQEINNLADRGGVFANIQQQMKDRVLQVRRVYDYKRESGAEVNGARPYDKEAVPALRDAVNTSQGLVFRLYSNKAEPWVPALTLQQKRQPGTLTQGIVVPEDIKGSFSGEWEGYLAIPEEGLYAFFLTTDDNEGSKAFVRLHDMALIDADFAYTAGTEVSSSSATGATEINEEKSGRKAVPLKAGLHPIRIGYVHAQGTQSPGLVLKWQKKGSPEKETIPSRCLVYKGKDE